MTTYFQQYIKLLCKLFNKPKDTFVFKEVSKEAIVFQSRLSKVQNPYEGKDTAKTIREIITDTLTMSDIDLKKEFHDLK